MQSSKLQFKVQSFNRGFTLIELVIVIGIIGILAGAIIFIMDPAKQLQKARDGQRKADLRQIQSALEIYRSDIGSYPSVILNCSTYLGNPSCTNTYLKKVPTDSKGSSYYNSGNYYYSYTSSTGIYTLAACLENSSDTDQNTTSTSPGGSGTCSSGKYFVLNNP